MKTRSEIRRIIPRGLLWLGICLWTSYSYFRWLLDF